MHRVVDATVSSRAIVMDVDTPDQINAVFDTISYSKGSSVIRYSRDALVDLALHTKVTCNFRMMENFMGNEDFKAGITKFLEDFSYKNAVTQDLFDSLEAACDLPITEVIFQPNTVATVLQQVNLSDHEHVDQAEGIPRPHVGQDRFYLHRDSRAFFD